MHKDTRMSNDSYLSTVGVQVMYVLDKQSPIFSRFLLRILIIPVFIMVVCRLNNIMIIAGLCCDGLGESSSGYP